VHDGLREVTDTADVVEVQVGQDDVLHISRVEAEAFNAGDRRVGVVPIGLEHMPDHSEPAKIGQVVAAEAGVDEHQSVRRLDEQDVGDEGTQPMGTHEGADEVMHTHPDTLWVDE
jgi:hypothetical protein